MRSAIVAGAGGLVLGHILWLIAMQIADRSAGAVLVVSALVVLGTAAAGRQAWQRYQRNDLVWASGLAALPVLPVIFTIIVLGVTYL